MTGSPRPTLRQRLRYGFDNAMARGPVALIGLLFVATFAMILLASAVIQLAGLGPPGHSFGSRLYQTLLRAIDTGTVAGDTGAFAYVLVLVLVTFAGIFLVSSLIGVLTTGIEGRLRRLRRGRSLVLERDHTLILGWSDEVFTIVRELVIDNASERRPRVVIMADRDKVEMDDAIREKVGDTGRTRVIVRSGNPIDLTDLPLVNPHGARSIIVLGPGGEDPDAEVIKILLAITNDPARRRERYHLVAEIQDPDNLEAARLAGGDEVQLIDVNETIARLIAQTSRQAGLSVVYLELLDFAGDEIYFHPDGATPGRSFGELLNAFERVCVIGLLKSGRAVLDPPMDTPIEPGDELIVIAQDDSVLRDAARAAAGVDRGALREPPRRATAPERILLLGWNVRATAVINELDAYVSPGSSLTVLTEVPGADDEMAARCGELRNLHLEFHAGDPVDRRTLETVGVDGYEHVVVLSGFDRFDHQRADARTLLTLLHLREMASRVERGFSIVSEMMDDRNRKLAEATKAEDFIVSDRLVSLLLAQMSQSHHLQPVFADILDAEGAEIYLKPAQDYVEPAREVAFATVVEAARRRGEVAIGYRTAAASADASAAYGVSVNPPKSRRVTPAPGDRVIVIAQD
ncbi:MAG: CASTOR/POLLUX-related putative ion channel [Solirubrobacteraceae bacterium]